MFHNHRCEKIAPIPPGDFFGGQCFYATPAGVTVASLRCVLKIVLVAIELDVLVFQFSSSLQKQIVG